MFFLKFIGCGAGFSRGLGNNSAILYQDKPENGYFLIDCGESTRVKLVEMDLLPYLKGVFITHLHGDHIYGLEMLGFYWKFVRTEPLPLYLPSLDIWKELDKIFMPTMQDIQDSEGNPQRAYFKDYFHTYIGPAFNLDENLYLEFVEANHVPKKECYGLRINIDAKEYLYTSDQATQVEDIGYDMIWHDCSFYDQGKAKKGGLLDWAYKIKL